MKKRVIQTKDVLTISTDPPQPPEAFDRAAIEIIPPELVHKKYSEFFVKHKDKLLNLVISRIALDSVMHTVQAAVNELTNGEAIKIDSDGLSDKISDIFDKALQVYAYEAALSEVVASEDIRKEYILKHADEKQPVDRTPSVDTPLGKVYSKNPEAMKNTIHQIEKLIESKLGKSDSTSPYGDNKLDPKNSDGKVLPKAGIVTRKPRQSSRSRRGGK